MKLRLMKCFFDIQRWMDFQSARSPQMKATSLDFLFPSALCWTDSHEKRQTLLDTWRERKVLGNRIAALVSTGATLPHPVQRWLVRVFGKMVIDSYPGWCQGCYLSSCTKSRQVWGTKIWHTPHLCWSSNASLVTPRHGFGRLQEPAVSFDSMGISGS